MKLTRTRKLAITGLAVAGAAVFAGIGTYATFTATTNQTQGAISTGTVHLTSSNLTGAFQVAATTLAPGDTVQRPMDLSSDSTLDFASVTLTTTKSAASDSVLFSGATNPNDMLTLQIDSCSVAWTAVPNAAYTCSGTTSSVLSLGTIQRTAAPLSNLTVATAGAKTDHLLITEVFPAAAGSSPAGDQAAMGKSVTVDFAYTATQRAGGQFK